MFDEKTDNINSFKRAIALKAIASKAEELKNKGTAPFEIQSFINDSRGEVTKRIPDTEMHGKAVRAAAMQKNTRS
jgi:hypothetical protein